MTNNESRKFRRPKAPLIGVDGNIFNLLGIAITTLRDHGYPDQASEMSKRVQQSKSYEDAFAVILEYVKPVKVKQ